MEIEELRDDIQFLVGGGEMGKLIREKDWRKTTLGDPRSWPQSLRTTLSIILNSKFPMFLFWGKELICFYNDAYRPSLGKDGKHPSILGMKGIEAWPEIWLIIQPLIDQVLAGGEATWNEDQLIPIYRNGKIEDVYWTFSYSPVNDESGTPAGVFVTCTETTDKVVTRLKLKDSKDQLEFAIEAARLGTWDYNPLTDKFSANQRLKEWFGLGADEQIELSHALNVILEIDRTRVKEAIQKSLDFSSGGKYDVVYTIVHPLTGKETIVRATGRCWFNDDNRPYRFNGTLEDVTGQVIASKKVKESEQRFQAAVKAVQGVLWTNSAEGRMEGEQPGWAELTGQRYDQYQGYGWADAVHPDDALPTIDAWNKAVRTASTYHFEHRLKVKDGSWRDFSIRAIPLLDSDGTLREWVGVHTDITERKIIENKIRESERYFRSMIDVVPTIIWIAESDGYCSYLNKQWYDYTGQSKIEGEEFGLLNCTHPDDAQAARKAFVKANSHQRSFSCVYRLRNKEGEYRWVVNSGGPKYGAEGKYQGMIGTVVDIHDEKISAEQIKESEERYHHLIISSPSAIGILKGENLIITTANEAIIQIWGKGREIMGKAYFEALPELAEQGYKEVFAEVFRTGKPFNAVETPVNILQNGEMKLKYYNFLLYAQRNFNGDIDGIGIIATEVTSQALLNKQVKESERRFRLLADSMPQHIWTSDTAGNLNYFNQSVLNYSGLSVEQLKREGWIQIVHPDDRERNIIEWMRSISTGKDFLLEHRFRKHTGEYRWQLSRAIPQRDENGKIQMWVGTSTDIQEQKVFTNELEEQVNRRTKELAESNVELSKINKELQSFAYISSHDLQEPLRKIQTLATRIIEKENKNLSESGKDYFKRMQASANRMQILIEDLLAYSRTTRAERKFENTDLNKIVEEVREDLREELEQKRATIESTDLCHLNIIPFQFRQLLHNLLSNALKFSRPGQPPHVIIKNRIISGAEFEPAGFLEKRKYCHISVSDNGIGFDQQYSDKIFEVFQRLHGNGEYGGTGIGLAIVKKIVDNHNGTITVQSELNKGAIFNIYIPVT